MYFQAYTNWLFYGSFNINKEKNNATHRFLPGWLILNIYLEMVNHAVSLNIHILGQFII